MVSNFHYENNGSPQLYTILNTPFYFELHTLDQNGHWTICHGLFGKLFLITQKSKPPAPSISFVFKKKQKEREREKLCLATCSVGWGGVWIIMDLCSVLHSILLYSLVVRGTN